MPTKWPAVVMPGASPLSVLTSPKSVRYACSSSPVSSTLPGLTSRWTSPRRCAASSAEATWVMIATARCGSNGPSRTTAASRSVPSTKRMAM